MFWLLKKIFGLGVTIAVIFFALHFQVGGRPVKDYLADFCRSPLVQSTFQGAWRQSKDAVLGYLRKDIAPSDSPDSKGVKDGAPMDQVDDDERKELEDVLKKKSH
jgi:hypothetical protein